MAWSVLTFKLNPNKKNKKYVKGIFPGIIPIWLGDGLGGGYYATRKTFLRAFRSLVTTRQ